MIDVDNPPKELKNWIKRAKRCFTECPSGVWFYVADSTIHLMACGSEGERMITESGGIDSDYVVGTIPVQDIDGGGW